MAAQIAFVHHGRWERQCAQYHVEVLFQGLVVEEGEADQHVEAEEGAEVRGLGSPVPGLVRTFLEKLGRETTGGIRVTLLRRILEQVPGPLFLTVVPQVVTQACDPAGDAGRDGPFVQVDTLIEPDAGPKVDHGIRPCPPQRPS